MTVRISDSAPCRWSTISLKRRVGGVGPFYIFVNPELTKLALDEGFSCKISNIPLLGMTVAQ